MARICCLAAAAALILASSLGPVAVADERLKEKLDDEHSAGADFWVYNDIPAAIEKAKKENKPLFVTFRCVPCESCSAFDAEVAKGSERIQQIAKDYFIPVRQVEMKGVDLTQFQFDHDLNWAAMFIHPDGTVFARYGTQSAEGPDAYNSIEGLQKTMFRVLELHENYPGNADKLKGKRAKPKAYKTALDMPGMQNKEKLRAPTARNNCIHCHMIHDAENMSLQEGGRRIDLDRLYRYPLPDNLGLKIDPDDGRKIADVKTGSAAAQAGLEAGDEIVELEGQAITSIADIQWVLHHKPNDQTAVQATLADGSQHRIELQKGWKKTDFSWRGSMWSVSPRLRVWMPEPKPHERKQLKLDESTPALVVKWINAGAPGGKAARDAGLRNNDVILEIDGKQLPEGVNPREFNLHVKMNYQVGQKLPLTILRNGKRMRIEVPLVE